MPPTQQEAEAAVRTLIEYMGDDPTREGLLNSPRRSAKALRFLTAGYGADIAALTRSALFTVGHEDDCDGSHEVTPGFASSSAAGSSSSAVAAPVPVPRPVFGSGLVEVRGIEIYSLCEHHLLPFFGTCRVAYLPEGKVLGLSKLARVADAFSRRLQIQERLTYQIAEALWQVLQPHGIRVVIECTHMCMSMRGVEQPRAVTITRAELGSLPPDGGAPSSGVCQPCARL
jgi:GTP cyclohydrolase I